MPPADSLAKIAVRKRCDWIEFERPPKNVRLMIRDKCSGSTETENAARNMH